ncbi:MAG: cobalamin biosynthesis protein, partial [Oscillospiraceae bacterium]
HIGAVPVITTATDINSLFAVDVFCKKNNLHISDMKIAKEISARLLKKQEVCIFPNEYTFSEIPKELTKKTTGEVGIYIGNDGFEPFGKTLVATVKDVFVGVGMKKGTSFCDFEKAFLTFLEENKISLYSVKGICSIDLKKDEQAIIMLSEKYKIQTIFFSSKQLCEIEGSFTSSDFVKSVTGTENVCEKSAFLGSGKYKIIKRKTIINHITFALAKEKTDIVF